MKKYKCIKKHYGCEIQPEVITYNVGDIVEFPDDREVDPKLFQLIDDK